MNYQRYIHLPREKRIEKMAKIFCRKSKKLRKFGLTLDSSCIACDFILSLPISKLYNKRIYRGVYKRKGKDRWYSKITKGSKYMFIGNFISAKGAAIAFDNICWELYKDPKKLNYPKMYKEKHNAVV